MANFNSLNISKVISTDSRISIKKGFLGFGTKVVYNPTLSKVKAFKKEYSPVDGEIIYLLLNLPIAQLIDKNIQKIPESSMGHYLLEGCLSQDHMFVALQLSRYINFCYEPVSDVKIYEGTEAEKIALLF